MGGRAEDALMAIRGRVPELLLLLAAIALGAFLRLDHVGKPSYWLDEILGDQLTTTAASEPWWRWVTGLEKQHGPLYYGTQLTARVAGHDEATGRLPAVLFGLATIPLVAVIVRRSGGTSEGAIAAAVLLAVSPLHVYYSREARPYALLMFLTAVLLLAVVGARPLLAAAASLAMLYTSAVAAPVLAAAAVTAVVAALISREEPFRRRQWMIVAEAAAAVILAPLLYGTSGGTVSGTARSVEMSTAVVAPLLRSFVVSARGVGGHDATVILAVLFAIGGAIAIGRRDRRALIAVMGMIVLPALFTLATLAMYRHWFAVRYFAPSVIGFIVLAGAGAGAVARSVTRRLGRRWPRTAETASTVIALAIVSGVAADTWRTARTESFEKLDWRSIAAAIRTHLRSGDIIVPAEAWSDVSLRYYLGEIPAGVRFMPTDLVPVAEMITKKSRAAWFVTAGYSERTAVREWICRYPLLLSSSLEEFRLHYAPSAGDFVQTHAAPEELRALAASLGPRGVTLRLGMNDESLLGAGWSGGEGTRPDTFRWVVAPVASVAIPRQGPQPRTIRIFGRPVTHPTLPPQWMTVRVNGAAIGGVAMDGDSRQYAFSTPASAWRDGVNVLSLEFSRTNSPASLIPSSHDTRTLAAAFEWISVADEGSPAPRLQRSPVPTLRLAADSLFRTRITSRSRRTRFPPSNLNRAGVEALLGRLGFDPVTAWPHLARGEVYVEDAAATLAWDSACEDDRAFVDHAFAIAVRRAPNAIEFRDLVARMRTGTPRVQIVGRILRVDDFRRAVLK